MPSILVGERYGHWIVLTRGGRYRHWLCRCICGLEKEVYSSNLRGGSSTNCGCVKAAEASVRERTHGGKGTRIYTTWQNMRERCRNSKRPDFKYYGGQGVGVCAEWEDFAVFRDWALANGYRDDLTIDRIIGSKGYEPANCRWVTRQVQAFNRERTPKLSGGQPAIEVARANRIGVGTYLSRLRIGWTPEQAATRPVRSFRKSVKIVS